MLSKLTQVSTATIMALGLIGAAGAEEGRYIVKYKDQILAKGKPANVASQAVIHSAVHAAGGKVVLPLNAMGATAFTGSKQAVAALLANPNVEYVEIDARRHFSSLFNDDTGNPSVTQLTPYAIYQSEANQVSLNLANAKTVCVIDSGIAGDVGETGGQNNDFDWSNITGSFDSGTGDWFRDGGPHGTHVAGTVAAANNGFGVIGMAPGNPLHIVKVFNAAGWGYSSSLAKAESECSAAGASIITMSLGGGRANRTEENAFKSFEANGGLVLAAAGNDGNTTRSFPAGYESVMMIGANDADNNIASFSQYPSCRSKGKTRDGFCVEVTAGGVNTLSTFPAGGATIASLVVDGADFDSSAMENSGTTSGATYDFGLGESVDAGASGKICVISRGNITFHDKVLNCENSGGTGAIIYNNEPGMLFGTLGDTNATSIPAVGATQADGAALVASSNATVSVEAGDYGFMSGTSMATPGVAGVAALVWSNHPTCDGTQIRDALKVTAEDNGAAGKDVFFGYGITKAKAANDYLTANPC